MTAIYGVYGGLRERKPTSVDAGLWAGRVEIPRADRREALRQARHEFRDTRVIRVLRDWVAERDQ